MGTSNILVAFAAALAVIPEAVRRSYYGYYSDYFKSVEGIRPRWASDYSIPELESSIALLDAREHECMCPDCFHGDPCKETMPTEGEGWSFTPAA